MTRTIHHATAKRAEKEGIALVVGEDSITATTGETTFEHTDAKTALEAALLQRTLTAEYPAVYLSLVDGVFHTQTNDAVITTTDDVPKLADVLDAATEAGIDPEEGNEEDEEDHDRGGCVAALYKQRYADGGHPEHCGDWLAYQLEGAFVEAGEKGQDVFSVEAFTACLVANGVPLTDKWAALPMSRRPGWQGRYRMNGRQKLEFRVAQTGQLHIHGSPADVPEEALATLRTKHPKAAPVEEVAEAPEA